MKIAIVGAVGEGKTRFVNEVLFPALLAHKEYGFEIREDGVLTAHRGGTPMLQVATFGGPVEAAVWLGWRK